MTPVTAVANHIFVSGGPPAQDPNGPLMANRPIHTGHLGPETAAHARSLSLAPSQAWEDILIVH